MIFQRRGLSVPIPYHGEDCKVIIYRTNCPKCEKSVYFLSCNHGSRVFLDTNAPPWYRHEDSCAYALIRHLIKDEKKKPAEVRLLIERYSNENKLSIPPKILKELNKFDRPRKGSPKIIDILPPKVEAIILGKLHSYDGRVDFYSKFEIAEHTLGGAFLGSLLRIPHGEAIILEDPNELAHTQNRYTCYVEQRIFNRAKLKAGSRVFAVLKPETFAGRTVWIAETFEKE